MFLKLTRNFDFLYFITWVIFYVVVGCKSKVIRDAVHVSKDKELTSECELLSNWVRGAANKMTWSHSRNNQEGTWCDKT